MALLARFACGCKRRVEIPAPPVVRCPEHGAAARLVPTARGQVRYAAVVGAARQSLPGGDAAPPRDGG